MGEEYVTSAVIAADPDSTEGAPNSVNPVQADGTEEPRPRLYPALVDDWSISFIMTALVVSVITFFVVFVQGTNYDRKLDRERPEVVQAHNAFWEMVDGEKPLDNTSQARLAQDIVTWVGGREAIENITPESPLFSEKLGEVYPDPDQYPRIERETGFTFFYYPAGRFETDFRPRLSGELRHAMDAYQLKGLEAVLIDPASVEVPEKSWPHSVLHGWGWLWLVGAVSTAGFVATTFTGVNNGDGKFYVPRPGEPLYTSAWKLAPHCMALAWIVRNRDRLLHRPKRALRHHRYQMAAGDQPDIAWALAQLRQLQEAPQTDLVREARAELERLIHEMGEAVPAELAMIEGDRYARQVLQEVALRRAGHKHSLDTVRELGGPAA